MSTTKILCTALLKSGARSNQPCGSTVVAGTTFCKRHTPKDEESTTRLVNKPRTSKNDEDNEEEEEEKKVEQTVVKKVKKVAEKKTESVDKKKIEKKKSTALNNEGKPIFDIIEKRRSLFQVMKNKFGNYEHVPTGFVFDNKTDEAYGKQNIDGTITPLTLNDIELCKENNWSYRPGIKVLSNTENVVKKPAVIVEDDDDYNSQDDEDEEEIEDN
jgi:hypothetical protein